jgi:hypothetical protein
VNEYEILLMLDPELPEERQAEVVARTRELVDDIIDLTARELPAFGIARAGLRITKSGRPQRPGC